MSFIDETVAQIDVALSERREELARLGAARAALVSRNGTAAPAAPAAPRESLQRPPGTKSSGRVRRGARGEELLEFVRAHPGLSTTALAKARGIGYQPAYSALRRLAERGQAQIREGGWYAAA